MSDVISGKLTKFLTFRLRMGFEKEEVCGVNCTNLLEVFGGDCQRWDWRQRAEILGIRRVVVGVGKMVVWWWWWW